MIQIHQFTGRYFFLNPFYRCPVRGEDGVVYPSGEAAFHAWRTTDPAVRTWIAQAPAPQVARRRGLAIPRPPHWELRQHTAMRAVLRAKFTDPALAGRLRHTAPAPLVDGNYLHDQLWGTCRCGRSCCAEPGQNWLGRHLMALRAEIIDSHIARHPAAITPTTLVA